MCGDDKLQCPHASVATTVAYILCSLCDVGKCLARSFEKIAPRLDFAEGWVEPSYALAGGGAFSF